MPAQITTSETLVNTSTTGDQMDPTVTILSDGGWIVVWMGRIAIGSEIGIFAQRYDSAGNPVGGEFQVNSASVEQWEIGPSVAALPDGGWVVTWYVQSPHGGPSPEDALVYMQRYDVAGTPAGEVQVNTPDGYISGLLPEVAVLADGGWVIVWMSQHGGTDPNAYNEDIYGQRYDSSGTPVGGEFLINTGTGFRQHLPSVTGLEDGGWIVTWMSLGQDGSGWGVYAQRYNADGSPNGGETLVATTTAGDQRDPHLATLNDGGWVITWSSSGLDGSGAGIFAQRYDSSGAPVGGEFQVNTTTANDQLYATVEALPDGGWAITWFSITPGSDPYGGRIGNVYLQRYDADGNPVGDETLVGAAVEGSFSNLSTRLAALADGTLVVTWGQYGTDGSGYGVYALTIDAPTNVINGTEGDDTLFGTPGDDVINGLGGNDFIQGFAGNDWIDGGDGTDLLVYGDSIGPVHVNLVAGTADEHDADGLMISSDTLVSIEEVAGSNFDDILTGDDGPNQLDGFDGNDVLHGGAGDDNLDGNAGDDTVHGGDGDDIVLGGDGDGSDLLTGGAGDDGLDGNAGDDIVDGGDGNDFVFGGDGNDLLSGGAGNDVIGGGDGIDTVSYANALGGVFVDLPSGYVEGGDGFDTLLEIENLIGSAHNDTLVGNAQDNVFEGGDGHDHLNGRNGSDTLTGGTGHDFFRGGAGDDVISGGGGFDRVSHYGSDIAGGVTVSLLLQGVAQDTGQGMDILTGIESLSGTPYDDILIGDHDVNWLIGGGESNDTLIGNGGDDLLEVGQGDHSIDGGDGTDTASFRNLGNAAGMGAVNVSLALQGAAQDTGSGSVTLNDVENLSGSALDDRLEGDDEANLLAGAEGADVLLGGDGDDALYGDGAVAAETFQYGGPPTLFEDLGSAGNDILNGGKGDDSLLGGAGNDAMTGGQGADQFVIATSSGDDVITDFKSKEDLIVFEAASGADEFADLILTQVGKDTLVSWGSGDSLLLESVKASKLDASDFQFGTASLSALKSSDSSDDSTAATVLAGPADLLL